MFYIDSVLEVSQGCGLYRSVAVLQQLLVVRSVWRDFWCQICLLILTVQSGINLPTSCTDINWK